MSLSRPPHQPLVPPGGIEPLDRDMTVIVSADVPLRAVQERLAQFNQWLPIDGDGDSTVGQLVTTNSTGPLRLGYGAWRDLLLGAQFRNGKGELITAGGRTVKNVAGYDLTKFMVGQRSAFATLVTLTSRTYRRPAAALLAEFSRDQLHVNRLLPTSCRPQWAMLTPGALLCGFLGDERTIAYYEKALPPYSPRSVTPRSLEEDIEHRRRLWAGPQQQERWFRAAVPPSKVLDFVDGARPRQWVADAAFGVVIGTGGTLHEAHEQQERIHAAAVAVGGTVFFTEPGGHVVRWAGAEEEKLLDSLKTSFDPDHQLEPL